MVSFSFCRTGNNFSVIFNISQGPIVLKQFRCRPIVHPDLHTIGPYQVLQCQLKFERLFTVVAESTSIAAFCNGSC